MRRRRRASECRRPGRACGPGIREGSSGPRIRVQAARKVGLRRSKRRDKVAEGLSGSKLITYGRRPGLRGCVEALRRRGRKWRSLPAGGRSRPSRTSAGPRPAAPAGSAQRRPEAAGPGGCGSASCRVRPPPVRRSTATSNQIRASSPLGLTAYVAREAPSTPPVRKKRTDRAAPGTPALSDGIAQVHQGEAPAPSLLELGLAGPGRRSSPTSTAIPGPTHQPPPLRAVSQPCHPPAP